MAAADGQARHLPPDRPTRLSHLRSRPKVCEIVEPSPRPFVGRCAKAQFFHGDAWLD